MSKSDFTQLFKSWKNGDNKALEQLAHEIYPVLKRIARGQLSRQGSDATLNPTALVHEVFIKMFLEPKAFDANDRVHFFAMAAKAMRWFTLERFRAKGAAKRGGQVLHLTLQENLISNTPSVVDAMALNDVLNELEAKNPRLLQLVELRFFCGMTCEEAAEAMGISVATAKRDWRLAQAWLVRRLQPGEAA